MKEIELNNYIESEEINAIYLHLSDRKKTGFFRPVDVIVEKTNGESLVIYHTDTNYFLDDLQAIIQNFYPEFYRTECNRTTYYNLENIISINAISKDYIHDDLTMNFKTGNSISYHLTKKKKPEKAVKKENLKIES